MVSFITQSYVIGLPYAIVTLLIDSISLWINVEGAMINKLGTQLTIIAKHVGAKWLVAASKFCSN